MVLEESREVQGYYAEGVHEKLALVQVEEPDERFVWQNFNCGDRSEQWILYFKADRELSRINCKYVRTIHWRY